MKIDNNKITIPRVIKIPCTKCEKMIRSYLKTLQVDSQGNLSVQYNPRYNYREENGYTDNPLCKKCFQINNIKK